MAAGFCNVRNHPDYQEIKEICHGFPGITDFIIDKYRLETNRPTALPDNEYVRREIKNFDISFSATGKPFNEERKVPENVAKKENMLQNVFMQTAKDLIGKHAADVKDIAKTVGKEYRRNGERKQRTDIVEAGVHKIFQGIIDSGHVVKDVLWNPKMGSDNYNFIIENSLGDRTLVTVLVKSDDTGKAWEYFDSNRDAYGLSDFDHMNLQSAGAAKYYEMKNAPKKATNFFGKTHLITERNLIPVSLAMDRNGQITKFGTPDKIFGQTARISGLYTLADTMYEFYATHEYYDVPGSKGTMQVLSSKEAGIEFGKTFDAFMRRMGHTGTVLKAMGLKEAPSTVKDLWAEKGSYDYVLHKLTVQVYGIMKTLEYNTLNQDVISFANESLRALHKDAQALSDALNRGEEALTDYYGGSVFEVPADEAGLMIDKMKKDMKLTLDRIDAALRIIEARNKEQLEDIAMESKDMMFDAFVRPEYEKRATEELKGKNFKTQAAIRQRTQELLDARDVMLKATEDREAKKYARALYGLGKYRLSRDDINKLYAGGFFQTLLRAIRIDKFFPLKTAGVHAQLPIKLLGHARWKEDAAMAEYGRAIDGIMKEHKRLIKEGAYADDSSFMFNTTETSTGKKQTLVRPYNYDRLFTDIKEWAEKEAEFRLKQWPPGQGPAERIQPAAVD